jgi:hypothetical protein
MASTAWTALDQMAPSPAWLDYPADWPDSAVKVVLEIFERRTYSSKNVEKGECFRHETAWLLL